MRMRSSLFQARVLGGTWNAKTICRASRHTSADDAALVPTRRCGRAARKSIYRYAPGVCPSRRLYVAKSRHCEVADGVATVGYCGPTARVFSCTRQEMNHTFCAWWRSGLLSESEIRQLDALVTITCRSIRTVLGLPLND
jgi:hypothetical protein